MRNNITIALTLLAILLISWLDVRYFGITHPHQYSLKVNQSAHFIALMATGSLGYLNWKNHKEKWVPTIWLTMYADVILLLGTLAIVYIFFGSVNQQWLRLTLRIRNIFIGPMPFLAFYLLGRMAKTTE